MLCPRCKGGHLTVSIDPREEPSCIMCGFRDYGPPADIAQAMKQRESDRRGRPTTFIAPKRPRCGALTVEYGTPCQNPAMVGDTRCRRHPVS